MRPVVVHSIVVQCSVVRMLAGVVVLAAKARGDLAASASAAAIKIFFMMISI
jgi:hypothetical protein